MASCVAVITGNGVNGSVLLDQVHDGAPVTLKIRLDGLTSGRHSLYICDPVTGSSSLDVITFDVNGVSIMNPKPQNGIQLFGSQSVIGQSVDIYFDGTFLAGGVIERSVKTTGLQIKANLQEHVESSKCTESSNNNGAKRSKAYQYVMQDMNYEGDVTFDDFYTKDNVNSLGIGSKSMPPPSHRDYRFAREDFSNSDED